MLSDFDNILLDRAVKDVVTEIAINSGQTMFEMEKWLKIFCEKLHAINETRGYFVMAFILQLEENGIWDLTEKNINDFIINGMEACVINSNHLLSVSDELKSADQIDVGEYSSEKEALIFRINGEIVEVYIKGMYKSRINVMHPGARGEIRSSLYSRRCRDYVLVVEDHGKKGLILQMDKYWVDRQRRILLPGKTEEFFQKELFDWLKKNLSDGYPMIETKTNSGDRTDIDIYSYQSGEHYIIEVKWLGENSNGTKYGFDRILEGIGQIKTYLERDCSLNEACLVCYDGRTEEEHKNSSAFDKNLMPAKGRHRIIFLESKSASRKGEDYAANQS